MREFFAHFVFFSSTAEAEEKEDIILSSSTPKPPSHSGGTTPQSREGKGDWQAPQVTTTKADCGLPLKVLVEVQTRKSIS